MLGNRAPLRFSAAAKAEFRDAVLWYEEECPGLGDEFARAVRAAADLISSGAERWPMKNGLRRYVLRRFPYTIAYRFASDVVEILAVPTKAVTRPHGWIADSKSLPLVVGSDRGNRHWRALGSHAGALKTRLPESVRTMATTTRDCARWKYRVF